MLYFATYFDIKYLNRGLALYESLINNCTSTFKLFIVALDKKTVEYFERFPDEKIILIPLKTLEKYFPELSSAKSNRTIIEYYFTLSPVIPLYIFDMFTEVNRITTLDADIYFFSDPSIIFKSYENSSILITPHNFSDKLKDFEKYGLYNVSFQSFKNDEHARACLKDWKIKCIEWCYDYFDERNARFADQKYLDEWQAKFKNVSVIRLPQAGLAPWNVENYKLSIQPKTICVNDKPLIFYHYHGLRVLNNHLAFPNLQGYKVRPGKILKKIYHTYLVKLKTKTKQNVFRDDAIVRYNSMKHKSFFRLIFEKDDFLLFGAHFLYYLRLRFLYLKYIKFLK
jgi:hypothetical protein